MARIRLGAEELKYMSLFENLTGAKAKDCIQLGDLVGFLVAKEDMGLAIGKGGSAIEKVRQVFGKSVHVFEFSENPKAFIKNLFLPTKLKDVKISDSSKGRVARIKVNRRLRGSIIGQEGQRIKVAKILVKRHHSVDDIKFELI